MKVRWVKVNRFYLLYRVIAKHSDIRPEWLVWFAFPVLFMFYIALFLEIKFYHPRG